MVAEYIEAGDFKTIFIGYFLGNQTLFPFAFMIAVSLVYAYFQISNAVFLIILVIGSIMFGGYMGEPIYFLVLFFSGFVIFYSFSKLFSR